MGEKFGVLPEFGNKSGNCTVGVGEVFLLNRSMNVKQDVSLVKVGFSNSKGSVCDTGCFFYPSPQTRKLY